MIPKTFHRVWLDEEVPPRYEEYWQELQRFHPRWRFRSWERSSELRWLQNQELFDSFPPGEQQSYAFRSDIARYEILLRFGGVYVDTDVEPLRSFDPLIGPLPFIAWCSDEELDPAVIASPPGHPAMRHLVDDLEAVAKWRARGRAVSPPGSTGPRYVTSRWRQRDDVRRLPPITFFPYHWRGEREEDGPFPDRSYAVHHWMAGWKPGAMARSRESRADRMSEVR